MRRMLICTLVSGMWGSLGFAQEIKPEEILPAIQDIYQRGMDCVKDHEFDGSESFPPDTSFCNSVIDEVRAIAGTGPYYLMEQRDRSCFHYLEGDFLGNYEIKRLEASGEPGGGMMGRTPEEVKVYMMPFEFGIKDLSCLDPV